MFKERQDAKTEITFAGGEPMIYIAPKALDKMAWYVQGCDKEIGWLGKVVREDTTSGMFYIIQDVYLFEQEVNGTTCEISPEGLSKFATDMVISNSDEAMDILNNLRLWGHSHVNMAVSPSGQDNTQINTFKEANPWFVRVIANKHGEMEFCIYDFEAAVSYKNVKWSEYRPNEAAIEEQIKAEIAAKVKTKTYASTASTWKQGQVWREGKWVDIDEKKTTVLVGGKEVKGGTEGNIDYINQWYSEQSKLEDFNSLPVERDKNGQLTKEYIDASFTDLDLFDISGCISMTEVAAHVDDIDPQNEFLGTDITAIWTYACNMYKETIR